MVQEDRWSLFDERCCKTALSGNIGFHILTTMKMSFINEQACKVAWLPKEITRVLNATKHKH